MSLFTVVACFLVIFVATPGTAHAYLDANTGSMILQLVLGGVAGLALVGKLMWHRITRFLGLKRPENDDAEG
jgi:hypothetical protein